MEITGGNCRGNNRNSSTVPRGTDARIARVLRALQRGHRVGAAAAARPAAMTFCISSWPSDDVVGEGWRHNRRFDSETA